MVGNSTGISNAFLPDRIELREGDSIFLFGAKAEVVKEHIKVQLAERGRLGIARKAVEKFSEEFKLSSMA